MSSAQIDESIQFQLGQDLLESDSRYFEYGACNEGTDGAIISWMERLQGIVSGCVVHRVTVSPELETAPRDWLTRMEQRLSETGCRFQRFYLTHPVPALEAAFRDRGYSPRTELGYFYNDPQRLPDFDITLKPITDDTGWAAKRQIHADCSRGPDGYSTDPDAWIEMEQRKSENSTLCFYLIQTNDGEVCGAVGADVVGAVLRLKNIVVHPKWRRKGVGGGIVKQLGQFALDQGLSGMGVFGVPGNPGNALYQRLGLKVITSQTEWIKNRNQQFA